MARVLKKSWHEAFAECVLPHTDAPDIFVTWGALSLISAALKDHVYFETGIYTLYPNMFVILVAPPGIGKGTVMNMVKDINNENKLNKPVNTISDRATAEKIIETIADGWNAPPKFVNQQIVLGAKDHSCLIFAEEIRTLLGSSDWMLEFLEQAWSQKTFDYQTKNKGSVFIDNMCCSLLAASVPDFLRNVNREAHMVITGGFSSRCLFVYAEGTSKDLPFPEPLKKNLKSKTLYDNLILDLKEIALLKGDFKIDPSARISFEAFLKENRLAAQGDEIEAVANFRARVKAHILKLSMAFSVSRGDSLVINQFDMLNALTECKKVITNLNKLFRGAGDSMDAAAIARVQNFIEKHGAVSRRELFRNLLRHIPDGTIDRIIMVLESIGFLEIYTQSKMTMYRHVGAQPKVVGKP